MDSPRTPAPHPTPRLTVEVHSWTDLTVTYSLVEAQRGRNWRVTRPWAVLMELLEDGPVILVWVRP